MYPTRLVRHPSKAQKLPALRAGSATSTEAELRPTSASPAPPPLLPPGPVRTSSGTLSLDPYLQEPTTHAKLEEEHSEPADEASRGATAESVGSGGFAFTRRFEAVTENGEFLVLTGRDGELQRCEDEVRLCLRSPRTELSS